MAATPVISVLGEALSRLVFRALAMSDSFMAVSGNCSGRRAWECDGFLFRGEGRAVLGLGGRMRPSLRKPTARTALPALYRAGRLCGGGLLRRLLLAPAPTSTLRRAVILAAALSAGRGGSSGILRRGFSCC